MNIRKELNRQLYRQKAYGYEKSPYLLDEAVLNAILGGDVETLEKLISFGAVSLSTNMRTLSKNELRNGKYHFMILAASLAKAGTGAGLSDDEAYMIADIYSRKADRASDSDALQMLLQDMCVDYAKRMREIKKEGILSLHVRKCIEHIYEDLSADLSVKGVIKYKRLLNQNEYKRAIA